MTIFHRSQLRNGACGWAMACFAIMAPLSAAQARTVTIASPDGKVQAALSDDRGKAAISRDGRWATGARSLAARDARRRRRTG
ncbi:hypothetical protein [Sphingomonas sp. SORGH_AS_0879]|uniref:hypothetical protein n=1 Tax=Sphingomonas sp. SORGH_AS_0879 TaxID=3041790 RepID=UPI00278459E5|nr:hypothetical protein [Sphingomonas sp. SORGH_AS_0879]MDQ1231623.1 diaminopimelate epimerase [Sphingomonas sp. SORGH_AS_0879]